MIKVATVDVAFRADASLDIGIGHIMRCLTLAEALREHGVTCHFVCREHPGHLLDQIRQRGIPVHALPSCKPAERTNDEIGAPQPAHTHWLGCDWQTDARQTGEILAELQPDWLVVDHYALDARWERALASHYRKLMVIDDLADRPHACDLMLDQTFGREAADYRPLVPADCRLLCGSHYAMLRPDFAALRPYSLQRRAAPALRELLINMGGIDKDNATGQVLQALRNCPLPADCRITVVMGATAPWLDAVRALAQHMPWSTRVRVGVSNMAQLMADSDLAVGAAGATSWERCCLGLPTVMMVLAENQRTVARGLERSGAAKIIDPERLATLQLGELLVPLSTDSAQLLRMSECAASIVDGSGVNAVMREMGI